MKRPLVTVSPRLVGEALGVSESSVKRWSDQGLIETRRTGGGHRKLVLADVLRFVHERGYRVTRPELLELPGLPPHRPVAPDEARARLVDALAAGDGPGAQRIVVGLFVAGVALTDLLDRVVAAALHDLGDRWAHGSLRVYEEHRAVLLVHHALHALRELVPRAARRRDRLAIVATASEDPYTVALAMAELTLARRGWTVFNLGPNTPIATLCEAVVTHRPRLLGLGISHVASPNVLTSTYTILAECARQHRTAIVIGGPGATPEIREHIRYASCCANMRELDDFATSLDA